MKVIDLPVGNVFEYENERYQVTLKGHPSCAGCGFSNYIRKTKGKAIVSCCSHHYVCTPLLRNDKKHVIFKLLK